nr:peptidase G2 autoproteolytic cleavage domain-containing protein [uncultured Oscillibacter sp.]
MAGKTVEPTQGTTVTAADGAEIFNDYRERTWGTDEGYEIVVPTRGNIASGFQSHSEGSYTTATGAGAHAEGNATLASGQNAHAEGGRFTGDVGCIASGYGSHAEGVSTKASASGAHSEGRGTIASEESSHSEGYRTTASGPSAHAEGYMGIAEGSASHVEGGMVAGKSPNKASGYAAHAEGVSTLASGGHSHAEGEETTASNTDSHAEGFKTTASAIASHSEGVETIASGEWGTHAEGYKTQASANYSHAEGENTRATGPVSHAEGGATTASGYRAHAEGYMTVASGHNSHSAGLCTIAAGLNQTAIGGANIESTNESDKFIIGSGAVTAGVVQTRSNCFRVTYNGVFSKGSYNSSGADYAELFEWSDGNPGNIDRAGRFVTLEGEHIRLAGPGDGYILGIVSGAPSVVGDVYDDQWQGMYLTDVFGRPIFEDVEVPDVTETFPDPENPESTISRIIIPAHTERRQKLNPDYDPAQTYVPRSDRPEWDAVGLLGKLVAVDDGTCVPNGWATVGEGGAATNSEEQTRYRVMARLDERHVRILIL